MVIMLQTNDVELKIICLIDGEPAEEKTAVKLSEGDGIWSR